MTTRRLSAVLVADVVGFSAQMERDDAGTLARLRAMRGEVIDREIAANGGRIVKTTGDGLLVEFGSADASLRCAIAIQRALGDRNALLPTDDRLDLRIGINLGDVIADGDDIFGDGVNVAARLESLAPAGGICVSQAVRDQVHGTLDVEFRDGGEQRMKNIARPIRTYVISVGQGGPEPKVRRVRTMSVGVVPFTAWDGSAGTVRHAQSLATDFAGMLARCGTLITVLPMEGGRSESVRYLVHGELRQASDSHVIHVRMLNHASGQQLWGESCSLGAATESIAAAHALHAVAWRLYRALMTLELRRVVAEPEGKSEPLDNVMRALSLDRTEPDIRVRLRKKAELLEDALRRDPTLVAALNGLVVVADQQLTYDLASDRETLVARMNELTARALNLSDVQPAVWYLRSSALMYAGRMHAALQACDKAIALEPLSAQLLIQRAYLFAMWGRPQDALAVLDEARSMDPAATDGGMATECIVHQLLGHYAIAVEKGEKAMGLSRGDDHEANVWMAAAYAQAGDDRKAAAMRESILRELPDFTVALHRARSRSLEPAYLALADVHLYAGLRTAGLPEA